MSAPCVRQNLKPGASLDAKGIAKLIAGLDADEFQQRGQATEELIGAGKVLEAPLKAALGTNPSAEAKRCLDFILSQRSGKLGRDSEEVRAVRGVEVLVRIGTPEGRKVLEEFARGGDSQLAAEAERLKAKNAAP
ncbi:MAG TPA: hypothetical protein VKA46_27475 [Gemmataceae bacterium]|nr:hypothetical protein [Gemmataceae bacterium]